MLPPTRLTQLARDMLLPRQRVLDYWSPPRPEPRVHRLARWVMDGINNLGGVERATILLAACTLFAVGIFVPRPSSGLMTLAAGGLFMVGSRYNKPGSW